MWGVAGVLILAKRMNCNSLTQHDGYIPTKIGGIIEAIPSFHAKSDGYIPQT